MNAAVEKSAARARNLIRVARSRTGLGLFATGPIRKGTWIAEYSGIRIPTPEANELEYKRRNRYMFEVDKRWTIDGSPRSNMARYANHACRPNAEAVIVGTRVYLHARRKILPGEEITYNYGREYFELFFGPKGCRCATCAVKPAVRKQSRARNNPAPNGFKSSER